MDDPLPLMKMLALAVMPAAKPGLATAAHPRSKSPVGGAAAGLSCCVTATTKMKTATKKVAKPNHVSHPSLEKVLTDDMAVMRTAETKLKITVHAPCSDSALKAVEHDTMPAAVMRTWATRIWSPTSSRPTLPQRRPHMSARAVCGRGEACVSRPCFLQKGKVGRGGTCCDTRDGDCESRRG